MTRGDSFDIDVSGDDAGVDAQRFALSDDLLPCTARRIAEDKGKATVCVTLPGLTTLVRLDPRISAPTGWTACRRNGCRVCSAVVDEIDAERFEVTIAGSGDLEGKAGGAAGADHRRIG